MRKQQSGPRQRTTHCDTGHHFLLHTIHELQTFDYGLFFGAHCMRAILHISDTATDTNLRVSDGGRLVG